jgi:hypothetical protein
MKVQNKVADGGSTLQPDFRNDTEMEEMAASKGCEVIYSDEYTLLLDLDDLASVEVFGLQHEIAVREGLVKQEHDVWTSRSGKLHVRVYLPRANNVFQRLALQSMLGSDRKRDLLSLSRVMRGIANPIILFRPLPK